MSVHPRYSVTCQAPFISCMPDKGAPLPSQVPRALAYPVPGRLTPLPLACPPVGTLAAHCAQVRGASTIVLIDNVQYRLDHDKAKIPGLHTINFGKEKASAEVLQRLTLRSMCTGPLAAGLPFLQTPASIALPGILLPVPRPAYI